LTVVLANKVALGVVKVLLALAEDLEQSGLEFRETDLAVFV